MAVDFPLIPPAHLKGRAAFAALVESGAITLHLSRWLARWIEPTVRAHRALFRPPVCKFDLSMIVWAGRPPQAIRPPRLLQPIEFGPPVMPTLEAIPTAAVRCCQAMPETEPNPTDIEDVMTQVEGRLARAFRGALAEVVVSCRPATSPRPDATAETTLPPEPDTPLLDALDDAITKVRERDGPPAHRQGWKKFRRAVCEKYGSEVTVRTIRRRMLRQAL
jgi:hypothetical protein